MLSRTRIRALSAFWTLATLTAAPAALAQTVSIGQAAGPEGDAGTTQLVFTVSLSSISATDVVVDYATSDETAVAGLDYVAASGQVTIPAGSLTAPIAVDVLGETTFESDETFRVNLLGGTEGTESLDGQGTIQNDDTAPAASVDDCTATEGSGVPCDYVIHLTNDSAFPVTIDYTTSDATAVGGTDFDPLFGQVLLAPGTWSETISVSTVDDNVHEGAETFHLDLTGITGGTFGNGRGTGTILDDDPVPTLTIGDTSVTEGDSGSVTMAFDVLLSSPTSAFVTFSFFTTDGTATGGLDYANVTGTGFILPESLSTTVNVPAFGDGEPEEDEWFLLNLQDLMNANAPAPTATGTIVDDDGPGVVVLDGSAFEGDTGTTQLDIELVLTAASTLEVRVDYGVECWTADEDDFLVDSGTVVFAPGETFQTLPIILFGDTEDELDELIRLSLSNPVNAAIIVDEIFPVIVTDDCLSCPDVDGDGFHDEAAGGADCNDLNIDTHPGADEVNDGEDNHCSDNVQGFGQTDEIHGLSIDTPLTISWPAQPGAILYEVLRSRDAKFDSACTIYTTPDPFIDLPPPPEPGDVDFFLARPSQPNLGDLGYEVLGRQIFGRVACDF